MASSPWHGSPSQDAKMFLPSSNGSTEHHQSPHLVAPTPVYAGAFPLTQYDSSLSAKPHLSAGVVTGEEGKAEEKLVSTSRPSSSLRALADPDAILPVQGGEEDATAAIEKLEKLNKMSQSRKHWMRFSGYEGFVSAGSKMAIRAEKKQAKKEAKDDDSIISEPRFGEVKLGISSVPGYSVFAARRAKLHLGRSNTELNIITDNNNKADSTADPIDNEKGSVIKSLSLSKTNQQQRRRESVSNTPKVHPKSVPNSIVKAQVEACPSLPSNNDTSAKPTSVAPSPDLKSVQEEVQPDEAVKRLGRSPLSLRTHDLYEAKPSTLQKPFLMVQSPTEVGLNHQTLEKLRSEQHLAPSPLRPSSVVSSPSENEGNCDAEAEAAAEACQQEISRASYLSPGDETVQTYLSSSTSASSDGEGSGSDSEGSDLPVTQQEEYLLNLEHGEELTKKEKKKLLQRIRHSKPGSNVTAEGHRGIRPGDVPVSKRAHLRKGSLSNKVQLGLHYASSHSRNRRAMERYSPHPSRPNSTLPQQSSTSVHPGAKTTESATNLSEMISSARASMSGAPPSLAALGDISRSSTPGFINHRENGTDSRRSSISEIDRGALNGGVGNIEDDFCMSPVAESMMDREERWADLSRYRTRRQGTVGSVASSMTSNPSFRKRYFSLRRRKQNTSDVVEESDSGHATPKEEEAEKELEKVLGKLIAQEAPEELGEKYEYDVLYENQRGLMVFGIPKFSAKTLFQWDPDPWTNAYNGNSAYNIVNAQLPDPSWEWVHAEWFIDMSGDVDESGWQYSYNFGRLALPIFSRPAQVIPRANAQGNVTMNKRMAKKAEKRQKKEQTRPDDGLEALKRSARSRSAKWTGIPNQNTYARRRRWIRLRKRKALPIHATTANTPAVGTPSGLGKASGDWAHLVEEEKKKREKERKKADAGEESSNHSSDDESLSDLESDDTDSVASDGEGSSSFLPRETPGNLSSGPDPLQIKAGKEQIRQRRHAREFTGTIRELKSLLPAILNRNNLHKSSNRQKRENEMWMTDVDARNPFISWNVVKKRLDDDDLAFASTSLRARERRYAQKVQERRAKADRRRIPSSFTSEVKDLDGYNQRDHQSYELTKDALVEINFRRVMRVMRACKVDRQKLLLWKIWLGAEPVSAITEVAREEDLAHAGLSINEDVVTNSVLEDKKEALRHAKSRWKKSLATPDAMDVWDLLERRLDRVLLSFEYQGSRASLLRLLLTLHATSHSGHRFKQSHWSLETTGNNENVEPGIPSSLSPEFGSKEMWTSSDVRGSSPAAGDEWRAVKLPRLEFWSDLEKCAKALSVNKSVSSEAGRKDSPPLIIDGSLTSLHSRASPHLNGSLGLPSSSTTTTTNTLALPSIGSLANGPTPRRFAQSSLSPPHLSSLSPLRNGSPAPIPPPHRFSSPVMGEPDERDRHFLAELLDLPRQGQEELLVKTASNKSNKKSRGVVLDRRSLEPSNLISNLTRAAEEGDGDF